MTRLIAESYSKSSLFPNASVVIHQNRLASGIASGPPLIAVFRQRTSFQPSSQYSSSRPSTLLSYYYSLIGPGARTASFFHTVIAVFITITVTQLFYATSPLPSPSLESIRITGTLTNIRYTLRMI